MPRTISKRVLYELNNHIIPHNMVTGVVIQIHTPNGIVVIDQDKLDTTCRKSIEAPFTIIVSLTTGTRMFFTINDFYPFHPPGVKIGETNNIVEASEYIKCFSNIKDEIILYMQQSMQVQCLCCHTILCSNNWSASLTIHRIIDEFIKRRILIKEWYIYRALTIVCYKYDMYVVGIADNIFSFIMSDE